MMNTILLANQRWFFLILPEVSVPHHCTKGLRPLGTRLALDCVKSLERGAFYNIEYLCEPGLKYSCSTTFYL